MKISIVTPSYNSGSYIEETIQSIQNQTYTNIEHIIIDGNSADRTIDIVKKYNNIHWISEPDTGQSNAINKGFKLATGDILAWQNADDLYLPDTFKTVVEYFENNPDIDIVYGYYKLIDEKSRWICDVKPVRWSVWKFKHRRFVPLQPTVFWRRKVQEKVMPLDESLHYTMDVDFFAKAVINHFRFELIPEYLGAFRVHKDSKTQNKNNESKVKKELLTVLSRNFNYTFLNKCIFHFFYYRARIAGTIKQNISLFS